MNAVGIMQGRLSPAGPRPQTFPVGSWRAELADADRLGFDRIEWLIDGDTLDRNPLLTDPRVVAAALRDCQVGVESICADCFIHRPLLRAGAAARDAAIDLLARVIDAACAISARIVTVPLLEGNAALNLADCETAAAMLASSVERADARSVRIAVESDLPADALSAALGDSNIQVCYDLGNAAAAAHDIPSSLLALADRLAIVHVKDRVRGGASVPLGYGDVPFGEVFAAMRDIRYTGPLILETPRGESPLDAARDQLAFVTRFLAAAVA